MHTEALYIHLKTMKVGMVIKATKLFFQKL